LVEGEEAGVVCGIRDEGQVGGQNGDNIGCSLTDTFVGLEIVRNRSQRQLFIHQHGFIRTLLDRFRMTGCNPVAVPAGPNSHLTKDDFPKTSGKPPLDSTYYRGAIGGLQYVGRMTRPEILYAVNTASRYSADPGKPHWTAVKRILAYLAGTIDYGVCHGANEPTNTLIGYTDSDFAGCSDTRRSTSGILLMLNEGPIEWSSHLQKPVAQSTCEAEYYASGHGSRSIVWTRELLGQLGFKQQEPTALMCDNNSTMLMVLNPVFHDRTKHIEIKYHYIREQVETGKIKMVKVRSEDEPFASQYCIHGYS